MDDEFEQIFKRWFDEHKRLLFRIVRIYASSLDEQDDLFQEILLHLWKSVPNFKGLAKETTWIYRVALNTALLWRRSRRRRRKRFRKSIINFEDIPASPADSSSAQENHKLFDQLYKAIRQLPVIDSCVVLMHLEGLGYEDMTKVLGISKNHVGVRLNRAKKALARDLKGLLDEI
ncbi:MAG TPA: RNA polymerase sigma factor [Planctomycetes bacterium]|nr:RNA polymerase sigma factor [Planctomycetota bacterium]HIJ71749.1 RNA polymerase sigma factor [Planctomycetota bacterium]